MPWRTASILAMAIASQNAQALTVVIDSFNEIQGPLNRTAPGDIGVTAAITALTTEAIGGERDIAATLTAGTPLSTLSVFTNGNDYNHAQGATVFGASEIVWDGPDGDGMNTDPIGLGGIDLTGGNTQDAFSLTLNSADLGSNLILEVYTDGGNASSQAISLPGAVVAPTVLTIPYAGFTPMMGVGADFTNVGAITFRIDGTATNALDVVIDVLETTTTLTVDKTASDANGGNLEPGDVVNYQVTVNNPVDMAGATAAGVILSDNLPGTLDLDCTPPNAPTTSQGTVTSCTPGPGGSFVINIGDVLDAGVTTVDFVASVVNPLPAGTVEVCNQAFVQSFLLQPSNDPGTPAPDDETCLPITGTPNIDVLKTDALVNDIGLDGIANPGDTVGYTLTVNNSGNVGVDPVMVTDTVDANAMLICTPAPVPSQGSVVACNPGLGGDFTVDLGAINGGGGSATITAEVLIPSPFPLGVVEVCNQGSANGIPSDDPDTPANDDTTCTPVVAAPNIVAEKVDSFLVDPDNDNIANPGDSLQYVVSVSNNGSQDAPSVIFTDTVDSNSILVCTPAPVVSQGSVTACNPGAGGDLSVDLGAIAVGAAPATVQFQVDIVDPLPIGVTQICNQGDAGGTPTDDPDTAPPGDTTCVPAGATPVINATKVDSFLVDANNDNVANPGDTLEYLVSVSNTGNQDAPNISFSDTVDSNTLLSCSPMPVVSQGTVTACNPGAGGDFSVDLGTIVVGAADATIQFQVTIADPLPAGLVEVCNIGDVSGTPTDDPDTPTGGDTTCTPAAGTPILEAEKAVLEETTDGTVDPGEALTYTVTVMNNGNQDADGVIFTDTVDAATTLICPPTISQGTLVSCNDGIGGDLEVDLGTVAVGGVITIEFDVLALDPLPAGSMICNQGFVNGIPTDDPVEPGIDDPTCLASSLPPPPLAVPVLSPAGVAIMLALMALFGWRRVRREFNH
jgi:uncharacterized repeat protein (TIGR01451 family)/fimbrial isopeptide formation D2 family protein